MTIHIEQRGNYERTVCGECLKDKSKEAFMESVLQEWLDKGEDVSCWECGKAYK